MGGLWKTARCVLFILPLCFCSLLLGAEQESEPSLTVKAIRACTSGSRLLKSDSKAAQEHLKKAIDYLDRAKAANEKDFRADYIRGYALLHTGKIKEARQFIEKAIKNAPTDPRPLNLKATMQKKQKDFAGEIATLKKSLSLKEQRAIAVRLAKALRVRNGEGDVEAALSYEKLAKKLAEKARLLRAQKEAFSKNGTYGGASRVAPPPQTTTIRTRGG